MPRTPVKKVKTTIIVTDVTNDTKIDAALEFRERVYNDDVYVDEETIKKYMQLFKRLSALKQ